MTANEARAISNQNYKTQLERELDDIYDEIAIAAESGFYHTAMALLSNKAAETLKGQGYRLESRKDGVLISWE